jgi:hypothetical protein
MTLLILIFGFLVALAAAIVLRSNFGKDLGRKTDQQLYQRYNAFMALSKRGLDGGNLKKWIEANEESRRITEELERRGYDLHRLFSEEADAKLEGRQMDFSRARIQT